MSKETGAEGAPSLQPGTIEIRLNLALLALLAVAWFALTPSSPTPAFDPADPRTRELATLEDRFARDRSSLPLARELADRYLELNEPGLAVAVLRAADPLLLEDPSLAHRLAQAYERSGRVLDAYATADLALARCARALGSRAAWTGTALPRFDCNERTYATLDVHRAALERMVRWGVAEPTRDPRARVAYDLAVRTARVAASE